MAEALEWEDDDARSVLAAVPSLRPRRRRRNAVIAIAVVVFIALNAWLVRDIFATDAHARLLAATNTRTQTQLHNAQADSTALNATIVRARTELAKLSAANDALNRDASTTRAAAKKTSGELKSVLAKIQQQHGAAGPLATCVTRLQGALNALSGGDTAGAQWTLATVDDACKNAGQ